MNQNDQKRDNPDEGGAAKAKPTPIREAVGDPETRPARGGNVRGNAPASQAPGLRGQRERPRGPRAQGASRKSERGPNRRSDRRGLDADREKPQRTPLEATAIEELPTRSFEHEGLGWFARLCGETVSGSVGDLGAPLMHVGFYAETDPLVSCGEILVPGKSLESLPELRLAELLTEVRTAPPLNESKR